MARKGLSSLSVQFAVAFSRALVKESIMFRIRRIYDDILPVNRFALDQVRQILKERFPGLNSADIEKIPELLTNPLKHRFKSMLYVAEDMKGTVKGFAVLSREPELKFCYLDYISSSMLMEGRGIGGILYEHIRDEVLLMDNMGIFLECLPDDPKLCKDPEILKQNRARLRFYEKYGARPIVNTLYETPVSPGGDNPPYLVFDDLGQGRPLEMAQAKTIVRAILKGKYAHLVSKYYMDMVVNSFRDDPVLLRPVRYARTVPVQVNPCRGRSARIALVVNEKHEIHHVRERGYVESPVRIRTILEELESTTLFQRLPPRTFSEKVIREVHDAQYIEYFKRLCSLLEPGKSVYPYVFPIRNAARPPKELAVRAGYYCIDTFTPLNKNAFLAAKRGVDCSLTAAHELLKGHRIAYALVRPPGHHAETRSFGGFCYFNNAAIAANYLSRFGRIAILDIDYHHGNGQQQIFYERSDVLTVSIHGHPHFAYPYFSGFADEKGADSGTGFNLNIPLKETITPEEYLKALEHALKAISSFNPAYLIVCLGLDTSKGDPTGTWSLMARDFERVGRTIGRSRFPILVVQEGGYRTRVIGINARHFFFGLCTGMWG